MIFDEHTIDHEHLTSLRKSGYMIPIFKCNRLSCNARQTSIGRNRCPGKLIETGNHGTMSVFCGWEDSNSTSKNAVKIYTTDYEKYVPPESVIPII